MVNSILVHIWSGAVFQGFQGHLVLMKGNLNATVYSDILDNIGLPTCHGLEETE